MDTNHLGCHSWCLILFKTHIIQHCLSRALLTVYGRYVGYTSALQQYPSLSMVQLAGESLEVHSVPKCDSVRKNLLLSFEQGVVWVLFIFF